MDRQRILFLVIDWCSFLYCKKPTSIKLWSLSSKQCLHTFMYHTDSVWSLFSSHLSLEVFYFMDKAGLVCVSSARIPALGVNRMVAVDANLLWTTSSSSVSTAAAIRSGICSPSRWRTVADNHAPYAVMPRFPANGAGSPLHTTSLDQ